MASGEIDLLWHLTVETVKMVGGMGHELTFGTVDSAMNLRDALLFEGPNGFRAGTEIIDLAGHLAADVVAWRFIAPRIARLANKLQRE